VATIHTKSISELIIRMKKSYKSSYKWLQSERQKQFDIVFFSLFVRLENRKNLAQVSRSFTRRRKNILQLRYLFLLLLFFFHCFLYYSLFCRFISRLFYHPAHPIVWRICRKRHNSKKNICIHCTIKTDISIRVFRSITVLINI